MTGKKKVPMDVFEKHQMAIAKKTLNMNPVMANIMGGMSVDEAKAFIARMKAQNKA